MTRFALLATALVLAAPVVTAQTAPMPEDHVSPDGHPFTLLPVAEANYLHIQALWPGSAALSLAGKEGLLAVGPQLMFEQAGDRNLDTIIEDLTEAGANALILNTVRGVFAIVQSNDASGLSPAAEAINDTLTNAALTQDDLEWVKRGIEDGLAESEKDTGSLMDRTLTHLLADGDRRAAALTNRPFETVADVTIQDVRDWMTASFDATPSIAASGPLTAEEAGAAIDIMLAGLGERLMPAPLEPLKLRSDGVTAVIDAPQAETALVAVAFSAVPRDISLEVALDALAGSAESRLFRELREEDGATYGASVTYTPLTPDIMIVALIAAVPPELAQETLEKLRAALATMRSDGVIESELAAARDRARANEDIFLRDPSMLAGIGLDQVLRGGFIAPEDLATSREMDDLTTINDGMAAALPEAVLGVIVTPNPDLVTGDCIGAVPEELQGCDSEG